MTNQSSGPGIGDSIVDSLVGAAAKALEGGAAKTVDTSQIREHMEVIGADGGHVGTVDHIEGDQIKLARNDPTSGGKHHLVPLGQVQSVVVRLAQPAEEARRLWKAETDDASMR